jgi:predicted nucleotide-binding protein
VHARGAPLTIRASDKGDVLSSFMSNRKLRMFVGSSVENLKIAYAIQENTEHEFETTVWTQGIFRPSRSSLEGLIEALDRFDAAVFVFSPDDVAQARGTTAQVVRDNVVFELGLFIGRLSRDRTFVVVPRGIDDFVLPTDLLGLLPVSYDAAREDKNWTAALGPACNQIRQALAGASPLASRAATDPKRPLTDEEIIGIIRSWVNSSSAAQALKPIYFDAVDAELQLPSGSAARLLEQAASRWYVVAQKGPNLIVFEERPVEHRRRESRWGQLKNF